MLILVNKPFGVVCQFSPSAGRPTLADLVPIPGVYPAGRLDTDSEGLLVLTDDGGLQARIADPKHKLEKGYWAQVEGLPTAAQMDELVRGVNLGAFVALPARAGPIAEPPGLWARNPPIRERRAIPTTWLDLRIREGKNRQVRRMTARVGLPTLRLIRYQVGPWTLSGLGPGAWREAPPLP
jgi:23S rRNA pseudouridine2457 synthase